MADATSLDALKSLATLFSGNKSTRTTSGGSQTQTTSTDIDQETINKLLQSALEGNAGLAAVSQGQKGAGMYNSSTNRLLTNDLVSRLTSQVAAQTASKTTTTTSAPMKEVTQGAGLNQADSLTKLVAGLSAYQKLGGIKGIKGSINDATDELSSMFWPDNSISSMQTQGFDFTSPIGSEMSLGQAATAPMVIGDGGSNTFSMLDLISNGPAAEYGNYAPIDLNTDQVNLANSGGTDNGNFSLASSKTGEFDAPVSEGAVAASGTSNFSALTTPTVNAWASGMSALGLLQNLKGLTDGNGSNDLLSAVGAGASGYQLYKAASSLAKDGSLSFAKPTATASTGVIDDVLPYAGSIISAVQGDIQSAALQSAGVYLGTSIGGPIGGAIGSFIGSTVSHFIDGPAPDPHDNADTYGYRLGTGKSGAFGTELPEFNHSAEYDKARLEYIRSRFNAPQSNYDESGQYTGALDNYKPVAAPDATKYYQPDYIVQGQTSGQGRWGDSYGLDQKTIDSYNKYAANTYDEAVHFGSAVSSDTSYLDTVKTSGQYSTLNDALTTYHDALFAAVKANSGSFKNYI